MDTKVFIGSAAGFAGDRSDAGVPVVKALATNSGPRFLMYETLAERTLALCQLDRRKDPARGYSPALDRLLTPVLKQCLAAGIRIVGNFGAANPPAAARRIAEMARSASALPAPRIAIVEGDDLMRPAFRAPSSRARETGGKVLTQARDIISANLYLGAQPIAQALDQGADIVVTGRVAGLCSRARARCCTCSGGAPDDWDRLAAGTLAGHLLECGAQVTGRIFCRPWLQGRPRSCRGRISDRGDRGRWRHRHRQAGRHRRRDQPADSHRTTALRNSRSGRLSCARCRARSERASMSIEIGKDRVRITGERQAGAGNAQGHGLRRRRRAWRGGNFLRRHRMLQPRAATGGRYRTPRLRHTCTQA